MKQVLQDVRSGRLEVVEVPEPYPKSGGVIVRNSASLISAGTERMNIEFAGKSMLGKARERPDLVRQVIDKIKRDGITPTVQAVLSRLSQPFPLGYSCAGVVESIGRGAEEFKVGDRVACAGMGYASHAHAVFVPKNLTVKVPDNVTLEDASYVTLGAIAIQGVRVADVRLGESVAVIGLGLLGQMTVQILKASGCKVVGIDLDPTKVSLAKELGADLAVVRTADVEGAISSLTGGVGVDAVVIAAATDSNDPIELAGEICRDRGIVSMVGAVKMDVPRRVYYAKELQLRISRSYGPGRYDPEYEEKGRDYPIGYVRWTERRNMEEFLRLVSTGDVTPSRLTTHRFAIEDAADAYAIVTGKDQQPFLGILLTYGTDSDIPPVRRIELKARGERRGRVGVGFIGAGNFASSVLLPRFRSNSSVDLIGIATATGINAKATGNRFGFQYCTTDARELLFDEAIDTVVIATRHGSHARFATEALRAGKAVFVEKPLAINNDELGDVLDAQRESGALLSVGFNRRFSPLAVEMKAFFPNDQPLAIQYRVNAGAIPGSEWVHDPDDGGGRIIGEVCHFVDLIQFLTDDEVKEVFAYSLGGATAGLQDTVSINLQMERGSIASINYFSTGDTSIPKEMVEIYGENGTAILDDFRHLTLARAGKVRKVRKLSSSKGFDEEIAALIEAVKQGGQPPIAIQSLAVTTRATFAILESLRTGEAVPVLAV